jgi:hypothetical protein
MARCARQECRRWRPDALVRRGHGIRIDDGWYCSRACLSATLQQRLEGLSRSGGSARRLLPRVKLGALLVAGEAKLQPELLAIALESQRVSGRRLGEELLEMGVVAPVDVQRALARQASTKYLTAIDPGIARPGYGGLTREMVSALGLVPFAAEEETRILKVAYVAPLSRVALGALRELTAWTPDPYLVADEVWPLLVENYGAAREDAGPRVPGAHETQEEALARIARSAERGQPAKISLARLDSKAWVRVETHGHVEDVLITVPELEEDVPWQTASTLH